MEKDKCFASKLLKIPTPILTFDKNKGEWDLHVCTCEPLCYSPKIKSSKPWSQADMGNIVDE